MDVAITGATGFIGTAFRARLIADGCRVRSISRRPGTDTIVWDPQAGVLDEQALEGVDAVVHLAGEGIARRPWSTAQVERLRRSRIDGTRTLVDALSRMEQPPATLLSGSAIGFYGDRGDEILTEASSPGDDVLANLCQEWEGEADRARALGIRTVTLRTGLVLDAAGGVLAKQLLAYKLGLGARAGRGEQWMSWISLRDHVSALAHLLDSDLDGAVDLTAPEPVTNKAFTAAVAHQLNRPAFLVIPKITTRLPFGVGPMVEALLFVSQRVLPTALEADGFDFADPTLRDALASVLPR